MWELAERTGEGANRSSGRSTRAEVADVMGRVQGAWAVHSGLGEAGAGALNAGHRASTRRPVTCGGAVSAGMLTGK